MAISLSTGLRNGMLNATGFKEAFTNGIIYIYSGAQPASADAAVGSGTLLMKITKDGGSFSFGTSTNGLNFDAPASGVVSKAAAEDWEGTGLASGTATWGRLMGNATDNLGSSTTLPRLDFSVGTSGADLILSTVAIETGAPATISTFQFTLPSS